MLGTSENSLKSATGEKFPPKENNNNKNKNNARRKGDDSRESMLQ
jgi:hypothetical protein